MKQLKHLWSLLPPIIEMLVWWGLLVLAWMVVLAIWNKIFKQ